MQDFNSLFEIHANANNNSPMMLSMFTKFTHSNNGKACASEQTHDAELLR
jgi:hypothetical protein